MTMRFVNLLGQLVQCGDQVLEWWPLIDVVNIDVADDPLLIDHKECAFRCAVPPQNPVRPGYRAVGVKIRKNIEPISPISRLQA